MRDTWGNFIIIVGIFTIIVISLLTYQNIRRILVTMENQSVEIEQLLGEKK